MSCPLIKKKGWTLKDLQEYAQENYFQIVAFRTEEGLYLYDPIKEKLIPFEERIHNYPFPLVSPYYFDSVKKIKYIYLEKFLLQNLQTTFLENDKKYLQRSSFLLNGKEYSIVTLPAVSEAENVKKIKFGKRFEVYRPETHPEIKISPPPNFVVRLKSEED